MNLDGLSNMIRTGALYLAKLIVLWLFWGSAAANVERTYLDAIDQYYVELLITCQRHDILDIWPTIHCPGAVNTNLPEKHKLVIGGARVTQTDLKSENYYRRPACMDFGFVVDYCSKTNSDAWARARERAAEHFISNIERNRIFERLYQDQFLMLDGERAYYDIQSLVDNKRRILSGNLAERVRDDQIEIAFAVIGTIVALVVGVWVLVKVTRSTKRVAKENIPKIRDKISEARISSKESRTKRIVEEAALDEAARISTRAAMTVFDEKEVNALQLQINQALAKGDYDTAQALMSALRKISGK